MIGRHDCKLAKASLRKAIAVSAVVHAGALGLLAGWSAAPVTQPARFFGGTLVVQCEPLSPGPVLELASTGRETEDDPVLVMIERARVIRRQFFDTPADQVPPEEILPPEVLDANVDESDSPAAPVAPRPAAMLGRTFEKPNTPPPAPVPRKPSGHVPSPARVRAARPQYLGTDRTIPPNFDGNRPPHYPDPARRQGWEGRVMLRLSIAADGRVKKVEVVESSGYPILDAAAVSAVRTWRGRPAVRRGKPVPTVELLPVRFKLTGSP